MMEIMIIDDNTSEINTYQSTIQSVHPDSKIVFSNAEMAMAGVSDFSSQTWPNILLIDITVLRRQGWQIIDELKDSFMQSGQVPMICILSDADELEVVEKFHTYDVPFLITKPLTGQLYIKLMDNYLVHFSKLEWVDQNRHAIRT